MPILKSCCCCSSLETGSRAIAIWYIVSRSISLVASIIMLATFETLFSIVETSQSSNCNPDDLVLDDIRNTGRCSTYIAVKTEEASLIPATVRVIVRPILIFTLILAVILLAVDSMLLHGINNRRRGFMIPWIVSQIISIVSIFIILLVVCIFAKDAGSVIGICTFTFIGGCGLGIYFLLIVISHYQELGGGITFRNSRRVLIENPNTVLPISAPISAYGPGITLKSGFPNGQQSVAMPSNLQINSQPPEYGISFENKVYHA